MKKTLLSVLAGLAVINAASAAPSVEDRKAMCEKYPKKYVWVEKNEACVPINPCISDNLSIKETYCNTVFNKVQLREVAHGLTLVNRYVRKQLGVEPIDLGYSVHNRDTSFFGQDYLPIKTSDGGYFVFEFDDLTDRTISDHNAGAIEASCIVYDGIFASQVGDRLGYFCSNVSENDCKEIADLASSVARGLVTENYTSTALPNGTGASLCELVIEK